MNLTKKKSLAARTLKTGKKRIVFLPSRIEEIKEAITKQDIKDLYEQGAILIKEKQGKKKKIKKKSATPGNIRKKVKTRKKDYVIMTRKLRKYIKYMKDKRKISKEQAKDIRNKIKNRQFKNLAGLKDYIKNLNK